jgi:hypothetical protein
MVVVGGGGGARVIGDGFKWCSGEYIESKDNLLGKWRGHLGLVRNVCGESSTTPMMAPGPATCGQQVHAGDTCEKDGKFEGMCAGVDEPDRCAR